MTPAERRALAFFLAVAALGAGARAAGLGAPPAPVVVEDPAADARRALERQIAAVDSARASRRGARPRRRPARPAAAVPTASAPELAAGPAPAPPGGEAAPRAPAPAEPVDVDRADVAALEALPGVGPALARRIVADRTAGGPFGSVAGLSRVAGIGPRLEARLRPLVAFSGQVLPGAAAAAAARPAAGVPRRPP
jgi:competence protein ComEA